MSFAAAVVKSALRGYSRVAWSGRGGYPLVRRLRRCIPQRQWRSVFTTPDGIHLELDLATYPDCCMAFGLYELDTARWFRRLLRPGDHFVDGGANIGYFSTLAAHCVGSSGRVDAFEPQPTNRARLEANLSRNGLSGRVTIHPVALWGRPGTGHIHMFEDVAELNHGSASLFNDGSAARASDVSMARMDEVLAGTRPRLVKLDIEGSEAEAIEGMASLLRGPAPPMLVVEFNRDAAKMAGHASRAWIDRLLEIQPRYRLSLIGRRLRPLATDDVTLATLGQPNLLARCPDPDGSGAGSMP